MKRTRLFRSLLFLGVVLSAGAADAAPAASTGSPASVRISELLQLQGRGEAAKTAFREALKDPRGAVRSAAIQLLVKEAGAAAIPDIAPLVEDADDAVAIAAAGALIDLGGEKTAEPLRKALASKSAGVRAQTVAYLGDRRDDRFVAEFGPLLADEDADVRYNVVTALEALNVPQSFSFLMAATSDADHEIVTAAVRALGKLGNPGALDRLARLRTAEAPDVRRAVAASLVALGGVTAQREAVEALASDADPSVRNAVFIAMRDAPAPEMIPILAKRTEDGDPFVRRNVLTALKANPSPDALPIVAKLAADKDANVRASAVLALADRGSTAHASVITGLRADPVERVRAAVAMALGVLARPEGLDTLEGMMKDESPVVRGRVVDSAGKIGTDAAFRILDLAIADSDPLVRLEAVRALGILPADKSLPKLRALAKSEDLQVRLASIQQLGLRKDREALPLLRELQQAPAEAVRAAARTAIAAIETP